MILLCAGVFFSSGSILCAQSAKQQTAEQPAQQKAAQAAYIPIQPLSTGAGASLSMPQLSMPSVTPPSLSSGAQLSAPQSSGGGTSASSAGTKSSGTAAKKSSASQTMLSLLGSVSGKQDLISQIQKMSGGTASGDTALTENDVLSSLLSGGNETSVYKLLQKEINAQKDSKKGSSGAASNGSTANGASQAAVQSTAKTDAIIRFTVNGTNVLPSCKSVIFSQTDEDGTFLAAGERTYSDGSVKRNESFYIVFRRADGGAAGSYTAECTVIQDYVNKNSVVYQFALHTPYPARKTGNMITVLMQDGRWNAELVVSLAQN